MPRSRRIDLLAFAGLLACVATAPRSSLAQPQDRPPELTADRAPPESSRPDSIADDRIDPDTGRDKRAWPPDPLFDFRHMRLEMTIPTVAKRGFSAVQTLTLSPIGIARDSITLDAGPKLRIAQVFVNSSTAEFTHDQDAARLTVRLGRPFAPGEPIALRTVYSTDRPGGNGEGLTWSVDDKRTPAEDFMMHAQGEPQHNHLWFPCHDFPNVRMSTELLVTVPDLYEAVSNGRLVSVTRRSGKGSPTVPPAAEASPADADPDMPSPPPAAHIATYHWLQKLPHAPYLVTLVVGRFDTVNVGGSESARPGLWMPVYGPLGSADRLRTLFANTPAMVAFFEDRFATPYPWDKYAQIICRDFSAGAMENTSASTFSSEAARGKRTGSLDAVIAHELAHQWFGDLVTCASWEHVWLAEGWATLGEALWAEHSRGPAAYQSAILRSLTVERGFSRDRYAPRHRPMASNRYDDPDELFFGPENPYHKGCAVLHMLRTRLGDDVFFAAARTFLREHALATVETDDLRFSFETASGESLDRFFRQWVLRPGHPELGIDYAWTPDAGASASDPHAPGTLTIRVEQLQTIDDDNPAYAFVLPFVAKFEQDAATTRTVEIPMDSRTASATVTLPRKPKEIEVDPRLTVLSRNRVRQPLETTLRQLHPDKPLYVRFQAVLNLAETDDPRAAAALADLRDRGSAADEPDANDPDFFLSSTARRALARLDLIRDLTTVAADTLSPAGRPMFARGFSPWNTPEFVPSRQEGGRTPASAAH